MIRAKWFLAAVIWFAAAAVVSERLWFRPSTPGAAKDFEQCAELAEAGPLAQRPALLTDCGVRFAGRRKPGGGYSYYDFMQGRSFDIAGPNPTAEERKQIDQEYMRYLELISRDASAAELAERQNNAPISEQAGVPVIINEPVGPPMVLMPKQTIVAKSAASSKLRPVPCPQGSLACRWERLTSAVRNAFASTSKSMP